MPSRIESLTAGQLARIPEFRTEWIARGLSTQPTNRDAAGAAGIAAIRLLQDAADVVSLARAVRERCEEPNRG